MELYLDSVKMDEIKAASELGYLTGLTTTPTFMFRDGVQDIDQAMLDISKLVDILQVEALGNDAGEIVKETERLVALGLDPSKTVFKIPVSLEGTKACKQLVNKGYMVNIHLVYTLQQAYMALQAGATYVCPLVGRLQDQGHDALGLIADCVDVVEKYGYDSKIMFSSVRHVEHVKNALQIGVHTCTIPWGVMQKLTENHFTALGTEQFVQHTQLLTTKVADVYRKTDFQLDVSQSVMSALVKMSATKAGSVVVMTKDDHIHRIFTDGDLRRILESEGEEALHHNLGDLEANQPQTISVSATLQKAQSIFREVKVDTLVVEDNGKPVGLLDIQDII